VIWTTPQPLFDVLNREFHFAIDLCADLGNAKCAKWLDRRVSLDADWGGGGLGNPNSEGVAWLNPPYGREIAEWTAKVVESARIIVACLPGRTNPPWWHDHVMQAKQVRFLRRKQGFDGENGNTGVPPWGVVIAIFYPYGKPGYFERDRATPEFISWDWKALAHPSTEQEKK
jgi:site-specific DNA-methyltransferase (adenine-specific)